MVDDGVDRAIERLEHLDGVGSSDPRLLDRILADDARGLLGQLHTELGARPGAWDGDVDGGGDHLD